MVWNIFHIPQSDFHIFQGGWNHQPDENICDDVAEVEFWSTAAAAAVDARGPNAAHTTICPHAAVAAPQPKWEPKLIAGP